MSRPMTDPVRCVPERVDFRDLPSYQEETGLTVTDVVWDGVRFVAWTSRVEVVVDASDD